MKRNQFKNKAEIIKLLVEDLVEQTGGECSIVFMAEFKLEEPEVKKSGITIVHGEPGNIANMIAEQAGDNPFLAAIVSVSAKMMHIKASLKKMRSAFLKDFELPSFLLGFRG